MFNPSLILSIASRSLRQPPKVKRHSKNTTSASQIIYLFSFSVTINNCCRFLFSDKICWKENMHPTYIEQIYIIHKICIKYDRLYLLDMSAILSCNYNFYAKMMFRLISDCLLKYIHFSSSWKIYISLSSLSKTTADSKRYVSMKPRKNKKYCQSVNICLQRSFAFSSVNFLYLLVKDNDKFFLFQPTHSKITIIQCKTTITFLHFHYFSFASVSFIFR